VGYASPDSRTAANERITSYLREALLFAHVSESHGVFVLTVSNVSQVEQVAKWVRKQKGVKDANALLLQEAILNRNHYEDWRAPAKREIEKTPADFVEPLRRSQSRLTS
jgi:hypothetical protein